MNKAQSIKMNNAKERKRIESTAPEYPAIWPDLCFRITIELYWIIPEKHVFECYKTNDKRLFRVMVDGKLWKWKTGISRIMADVRKSIVFSRPGAM